MHKKIITIIAFVLVVYVLSESIKYRTQEEIYPGQVLGVNEVVEEAETIMLSNYFPESEDAFSFPKKVDERLDIYEVSDVGLVMDEKTNEILYEKNSDRPVNIASITKLATALTFLDLNEDLNKVYKITKLDRVNGGRIYVYNGDEVLVRDLLHLSLIASANTATCALIKSTGLTEQDFVERMNEKMGELGLNNTVFKDVVGLDNNVSTARDVAWLVKYAMENEIISEIVAKNEYEFSTLAGRVRRFDSTNNLFNTFPKNDITLHGGKTGFTNLAGYCFAGKFSKEGNSVISVVLNSETLKSRFTETEEIVSWVYDTYVW